VPPTVFAISIAGSAAPARIVAMHRQSPSNDRHARARI
jgi:hypothetical protein